MSKNYKAPKGQKPVQNTPTPSTTPGATQPAAPVLIIGPDVAQDVPIPATSAAVKVASRVGTAPPAIRRDLLGLWNLASQVPAAARTAMTMEAKYRLDRFYIAFHRLATEGKEYLFFVSGVHNGGWYTPKLDFVNHPMFQNCQLDTVQVYNQLTGEQPHLPAPNAVWPDEQSNASSVPVVTSNTFRPVPSNVDGMTDEQLNALPNQHISHQFCWHAKGPFFIWHRPYMMLFEQLLQFYDVASDEEKASEPLGCHYFAWETNNATAPHPALFDKEYQIRSDKYASQGFTQGSFIDNPLCRWYSPRSFPDQYRGFTKPLSDGNKNFTTREAAFLDSKLTFSAQWRLNDENADEIDPPFDPSNPNAPNQPAYVYEPKKSIEHLIENAMNEPAWHLVASTEWSPVHSMEEPHNRFHNRFGGFVNDTVTGTLTSNQSPFDPLFWPHHANVERQLMSWQRRHVPNMTQPSNTQSDLTLEEGQLNLYPWASPQLMVNTPATSPEDLIRKAISYTPLTENGGQNGLEADHKVSTMKDWFYIDDLPYTYDFWEDASPDEDTTPENRLLTLKVPVKKEDRSKIIAGADEYNLAINYLVNGVKVSSDRSTSFISAAATGKCAACNAKDYVAISFDVSNIQQLQDIRRKLDREEAFYSRSFPREEQATFSFKFKLLTSRGVELAIDLDEMKLFYSRSVLKRLQHKGTLSAPSTQSDFVPDETFFNKFTTKHFLDATKSNSIEIRNKFAKVFEKMNWAMMQKDDRDVFPLAAGAARSPSLPKGLIQAFESIVPTRESADMKDYYGFTKSQQAIIQPYIDKLFEKKSIASHIAIVNTPVDSTTDATWVTDYLAPSSQKSKTIERLAKKYQGVGQLLKKVEKEPEGILFIFVDAPRVMK